MNCWAAINLIIDLARSFIIYYEIIVIVVIVAFM